MSQEIDNDDYYDEKDKREKQYIEFELTRLLIEELRIICSIRSIPFTQKTPSKSWMVSMILDQQRKNRDKKRVKATTSTYNNNNNNNSSNVNPNLPWIVQSKIIYLLCSHRQNGYQQDVTDQDLFMYTLASVSKTWRQLTAACLTSPWTIDLSRGKTLEEYHRFSRHPLSLLSGANHNIQFVIQDIDTTNTKYIAANSQWFKEEVINNKVSGIQINDSRHGNPEWTSLIERPKPTLKKFKICTSITLVPLDMLIHLQELDITPKENSTKEICRILDSCNTLESLHLDLIDNNNVDLDKVFSSIPRTITKLYFRSQQRTPYPFNLLPTTITDLKVRGHLNLVYTQTYLDYLRSCSMINRISQTGFLSLEWVDFFSSPSSTIKHLYLHLIPTGIPTFSIKERPLIPPLIEVLELDLHLNEFQVMESIFKYNGPLSNLHTLRISTRADHIHLLIPLIMSRRSLLKSIDFCDTYTYYRNGNPDADEHLDNLLEAIAKSPCIEKVVFRTINNSMSKFPDILKTHLKRLDNNKSLVLINDKLTLFNINNYHYDLSSFEIIDYNKLIK
ncbi:hypothetical protein DFA_08000 [Cavenderia fasciculata]|uniref:Uncharacterized protein n=1 Tax=Cavenderia fasciculata TaxID=261658 RepID=F4Q4L0_CACFS|nr:uncharacterized protein DFA_08000 [Cavenderia fasciculata]EGG17019.1 hypothetical protein DFA_08000 [Cavenderia fasciculata]|eukprot:XP_004355503.1 hypothetical protein DFA_08000 [Cavenderia fasciculata]